MQTCRRRPLRCGAERGRHRLSQGRSPQYQWSDQMDEGQNRHPSAPGPEAGRRAPVGGDAPPGDRGAEPDEGAFDAPGLISIIALALLPATVLDFRKYKKEYGRQG